MRTLLSLLLIASLGSTVLYQATDGLRALTSEGARRVAVTDAARPVPDVILQDQHGDRFSLAELQGQALVINFIYTRCPTVCLALGDALQQLQRALPAGGPGGDVLLLSISFDPANDTPARLAAYAEWFRAGEGWRVTRPLNEADLELLLERFGVVVIPDGRGGFEHNAALHLVDREGRLVAIRDLDDVEGVRRWLGEAS
ncbi:MAG: SCO family protein [Chromatiales bacterium]|nr:SCO family protein [Chromatiales bacterium]